MKEDAKFMITASYPNPTNEGLLRVEISTLEKLPREFLDDLMKLINLTIQRKRCLNASHEEKDY